MTFKPKKNHFVYFVVLVHLLLPLTGEKKHKLTQTEILIKSQYIYKTAEKKGAEKEHREEAEEEEKTT